MSRWIQPKCYEQCQVNTDSSNSSVFIDRGKLSNDFWTDLFKDKCPNGLGPISENLKNNEALSIEDFLDDKDDAPSTATSTSNLKHAAQPTSVPQPCSEVSNNKTTGKQDVLYEDDSDNEQGFSDLDQGFKTPTSHKHKGSSTPCLFSPDLMSQHSQDHSWTPRAHHASPCITDCKPLACTQKDLTVMPHSLEKGDLNIFNKSPDILDQMIADKRPRNSLAFLSETNSNEDIDGWSDSMATPPMRWSPSQQGSVENAMEEEEKEEKNVARTLFQELQKNVPLSPGMSGFHRLDCCEEEGERTHQGKSNNHNPTRTCDMCLSKDETLSSQKPEDLSEKFKDSRDIQEGIKDKLNILETFVNEENEVIPEDPEKTINSQGHCLDTTLTIFPSASSSPSSYSQEAIRFLELVQSTPKVHTSKDLPKLSPTNGAANQCRLNVKRSSSRSQLRKWLGSASPLLAERTFSNEAETHCRMDTGVHSTQNPQDNHVLDGQSKNDKSTEDKLEKKSPVKLLIDVPLNTDPMSNIMFGSYSKSLEEAMIKETDMNNGLSNIPGNIPDSYSKSLEETTAKDTDTNNGTILDQYKEKNIEKLKNNEPENIIISAVTTEARADYKKAENDTINAKTSLVDTMNINLGKFEANLSNSLVGVVKQESPELLSVKRSSRNKRFSYPRVKRPQLDREGKILESTGKESKVLSNLNDPLEGKDNKEMVKNYQLEKLGSPTEQHCREKINTGEKYHTGDLSNPIQGNKNKEMDESDQSLKNPRVRFPNQTRANESPENLQSEHISSPRSTIEIKPVRDSTQVDNESANGVDFCEEVDEVDQHVLMEEVTDTTLLQIQENQNTPTKSMEVLFDMDSLSQFPYEVLPPTPYHKDVKGKNQHQRSEALARIMFEDRNNQGAVQAKTAKPSGAMTGFKTASGKDVSISEEALQKARAKFESQSSDAVSNLVEVKPQGKPKFDVIKNEVEKQQQVNACQDTNFHSKMVDQEVPSVKNHISPRANNTTTSSHRRSLSPLANQHAGDNIIPTVPNEIGSNVSHLGSSIQSPLLNQRTFTTATPPTASMDDNLSREILESSAALLADECFSDFGDCLGIHGEERTIGHGVTMEKRKTSAPENARHPYHSEPHRSQRETMMSQARQRYKSFLSGDERNNPATMQSRLALKPTTPSPSHVMFDRRSKTSQPLLKPVVIGPNMSTPLSRNCYSKREGRQIFARQGGPLSPCVSTPLLQSPLVVNEQIPTPSGGVPNRHFATPFRTMSANGPSEETGHKDSGSPERKRRRISGAVGRTNKGSGDRIKPKMGYLYDLRQGATRMSLRQYVNNTTPQCYTKQQLQDLGICNDVMEITCSNAESFRFAASNFFSEETCTSNQGIRMEDGGLLYIGQDGRIGLEEIERALLVTPGVDGTLVPHGWIANHYRWIVWKLASMEKGFPRHFATRCLTPDWVLCQLKYRYDREIDRSHRSALKKILERDDVSSRTMVLCVCSVARTQTLEKPLYQSRAGNGKGEHENNANDPPGHCQTSGAVLEMTDGWYSVNVALDAPLTDLLSKNKIFVGMKLCINGAELIGSDQAVSPLEAPSSLMLRISANSTRRALWDSRLGLQTHTHPFPVPLSSLFPNGGVIGCVDIVVVRQYPLEYMERNASGNVVFRNSRAEEREAKKFATTLERAREAVLVKVQKKFEEAADKPSRSKKSRRSYSPKDISKICSGKELYDLYLSAPDPNFIEECLDSNQRSSLEDYRRLIQDDKRAELEKMFQRAWEEDEQNVSKRKVVPILKVRVVNCLSSERHRTEAILTIWRPSEDILQLLSEGSRLRIYHLMASGSRYRQGMPSLQLSSTRTTRYKTMNLDQSTLEELYTTRKAMPFKELQTGRFALYSEIDLVGCVVYVISHSNSSLQTVYLTDDKNVLVAIKCWGGLKVYAVEDLVKPRSFIACTNLVVRSNEHVNCPTLAYNELSTLTLKPKEPYLKTALEILNENIEDLDLLMSNAQRLLEQMRRRPEHAPKVNTSRDCDTPINQGLPKESEDTKGSTISGETKSQTSRMAISAMNGPAKRKLLECIADPPASPSINITATDSVRRDFKRPRRVASGSPE